MRLQAAVSCSCGASYSVASKNIVKRATCKSCGEKFRIERSTVAAVDKSEPTAEVTMQQETKAALLNRPTVVKWGAIVIFLKGVGFLSVAVYVAAYVILLGKLTVNFVTATLWLALLVIPALLIASAFGLWTGKKFR